MDFKSHADRAEHLDTPVADALLLFGSVQPSSLITMVHSIMKSIKHQTTPFIIEVHFDP